MSRSTESDARHPARPRVHRLVKDTPDKDTPDKVQSAPNAAPETPSTADGAATPAQKASATAEVAALPTQKMPAVPKEAATSMQETALQNLLQQLRKRDRKRASVFGASFGSALEALWANRARSFLTMLGIFIGVAAVIAALTLTQSASAYFNNLIEGLGASTIIVQPGTSTSRGVVSKQSAQNLTVTDAQAIQKIPHVTYLSPVVGAGGQVQVVYGNQNWNTRVQGVTPDLQTILSWDMARGLWFSDADNTSARPVAVIGDTVAQHLFGGSTGINPVGQTIRIRDQLYRVVGVLAPKGGGFGQDDVIYIPFDTALVRFGGSSGGGSVSEIILQADTVADVDPTVQRITQVLDRDHPTAKGTPNSFQITTSQQILQEAQQTSQVLTVLLVGVAGISLTVGGIGIMNIMLVSVTQRTREIGIRMSIGARRSDIRNQFLIEALLLCLLGGGLGLLLGLLAGYGMTHTFGFPMVITATTVIVPFVVSSLIAVVFGLYPASRAARLDPVVALRSRK